MLPDRDRSAALLIGDSTVVEGLREVLAPSFGVCEVASDLAGPADLVPFLGVVDGARDVLLVYFAGRALLDRDGVPHLAFRSSTPTGTGFDSVPVSLVLARMSVARRPVLVLDCDFGARVVPAPGSVVLASSAGARSPDFGPAFLDVLRKGVPGESLSLPAIASAVVSAERPVVRGTSDVDLIPNRHRRVVPPVAVVGSVGLAHAVDHLLPHYGRGAPEHVLDEITAAAPLVRAMRSRHGDGAATAVVIAAALAEVDRAELPSAAARVGAALEAGAVPCDSRTALSVLATVAHDDGIRELGDLAGCADWRDVEVVAGARTVVRPGWRTTLPAEWAWPAAGHRVLRHPNLVWHPTPVTDATPLLGLAGPTVVLTSYLALPAYRMLRSHAGRDLVVLQFADSPRTAITAARPDPTVPGTAEEVTLTPTAITLHNPAGDPTRCRALRDEARKSGRPTAHLTLRSAFLEAHTDPARLRALHKATAAGDSGPACHVRGAGLALATAAKHADLPALSQALTLPATHLVTTRQDLLDPLAVVRGALDLAVAFTLGRLPQPTIPTSPR
ncbi:hypothetical protein [Actinosynnema sp. NPDC020468]|uniref:hypothetical protein n=1 Tax=Actinosynnema sp. NPDC020468 TaxID=3154488 RepID=UPI0033F1297E